VEEAASGIGESCFDVEFVEFIDSRRRRRCRIDGTVQPRP